MLAIGKLFSGADVVFLCNIHVFLIKQDSAGSPVFPASSVVFEATHSENEWDNTMRMAHLRKLVGDVQTQQKVISLRIGTRRTLISLFGFRYILSRNGLDAQSGVSGLTQLQKWTNVLQNCHVSTFPP